MRPPPPTNTQTLHLGNPGVSKAYMPWLISLARQLGDHCVVIFSGHLGKDHLSTEPEYPDTRGVTTQTQIFLL